MPDCRYLFCQRNATASPGAKGVLVCLRMRWRWPRVLTIGECDDCEHNNARAGSLPITSHPAAQAQTIPLSHSEREWLGRLGIGRESR